MTRETEGPLSKLDFRRKLKRYYNGIWQKHWASKSPSVTSVKRILGPTTFINLPRKQQTILTRLRLNATKATHGHYFKGTEPRKCNHCRCRITVHHLLITCSKFLKARLPLRLQCKKDNRVLDLEYVVSSEFPSDIIMKFLADTDLARDI